MIPTFIIRKSRCDVDPLDFLHEEIFFVEEKDHRRRNEPRRITYRIEQLHRFNHTILKMVSLF